MRTREQRNRILGHGLVALALCLLAPVAYGEEAAPAEATPADAASAEAAQEEQARALDLSGRFEAGADVAWSDDDTDANLDQTLQIKVRFPRNERVRLYGSLWTSEDLDSDESRRSVLRDIDDSYDADIRARLMHLYLEVDDLGGVPSTLRIGRQRILEGAALNRIDGLYYKQHRDRWDWYVFVGARASVYDDTHDDLALGGGVAYRLSDKTRLALDAYYGEEERYKGDEVRRGRLYDWLGLEFPRRVKSDVDADLYAFSVTHQFTPNVQGYGRFNLLNGEADELLLDLHGYHEASDISYYLAYRRRFERAEDRPNDVTAFYRILGAYEEYHHVALTLSRPLNEMLALSLDAEWHDADDANEYTGNHDYQRYAATLSAKEVLEGTDASLGLEYWDAENDEGSWALTGDIVRTWERWKLSVGADYSRYEYDYLRYDPVPFFLSNVVTYAVPGLFPGYRPLVALFDTRDEEEREDIHSLYVKTIYTLRENQDLTARISVEEDDGPDSPYWRLQVSYAITF